MVKKIFTFVCLIHLLSSVFLINGMELALNQEHILSIIFQPIIIAYHDETVNNQPEIKETFDNNPTIFNTCDVRLFFPKFPPHPAVNKQWNRVFKRTATEIQSSLEIEEPHLELLALYLYRPQIPEAYIIKDMLSLHPWSYITKDQLENNINRCIPGQEERELRLAHLATKKHGYQKTFLKNQNDASESTRFNLLLLTALELLPYNRQPDLIYYRYFFYQLFFNSSLSNASKCSFFNYLITPYSTIYGIPEIINIALESPHFKINSENMSCEEWYEKLYLIHLDLRHKILLKMGFSPEEIFNVRVKTFRIKPIET
jgi:hypothetical protein